jgi:hypothetical protein
VTWPLVVIWAWVLVTLLPEAWVIWAWVLVTLLELELLLLTLLPEAWVLVTLLELELLLVTLLPEAWVLVTLLPLLPLLPLPLVVVMVVVVMEVMQKRVLPHLQMKESCLLWLKYLVNLKKMCSQ